VIDLALSFAAGLAVTAVALLGVVILVGRR